MIWDILVLIANILLTVGIIPQLLKNHRTKNVESHSSFWHITTMVGFILLIAFYSKIGLTYAVYGLIFTFGCRILFIYQIWKYSKNKY
jgi:uncharacterized protein with PQ loop repeat